MTEVLTEVERLRIKCTAWEEHHYRACVRYYAARQALANIEDLADRLRTSDRTDGDVVLACETIRELVYKVRASGE